MTRSPKTLLLLACWLATLQPAFAGAPPTCQTASLPGQFTDNHDGTVTDSKTGLMWKRCSEGQGGSDCSVGSAATYTWTGAQGQAVAANRDGGFAKHTGWRVPTSSELHLVKEHNCGTVSIDPVAFPNAQPGWFWSSYPVGHDGNDGWITDFYSATDDDGWSHKDNLHHVRLVRSGIR